MKQLTGRRLKIGALWMILLLIAIQLYSGYQHAVNPVVKTRTYLFNKSSKHADHPPKAVYKLLIASDLHLGYMVDESQLQKYVDLIHEQHADIVVIDGDLIDYSLHPLLETGMDEQLRRIVAPKGVYLIPGNHDYKGDPQQNFDWIRQAGMTILKDSVVNIDNQFLLAGRDDRSRTGRLPMEALVKQDGDVKPVVLCAHQPGDLPDASRCGVFLAVCGHTHAGQVFPFNLLERLVYIKAYGDGKLADTHYYVSSGLGFSGIPLRIATCSEAVVFNIEIY
ncbi:MAG: metallophosphoesterase [Dysgonamonadaceae bacterium]|jgi:predicted MPP superfamily phosphohydrolase|nr:metallophosphoesterase [Dysgonamonadaceae bacterium]